MEAKRRKAFSKPRCCECGLEMEPQAASYDPQQRLYCRRCRPIADVKQSWRPMGSGSVSRMFVLDPRKK